MYRILLLLALALTGCATNTSTGPVYDPYESTNRKIYAFNDGVDKIILKPVARGYRFLLPDPLELGIGNVFSNLGEVTVIVNGLLQGKVKQATSDTGRFIVNSTVGVAGLFDVGTRIGLPKHRDTFGQTLGVWGVGEGPFLMLPFLGPSNGRATVGRVVDGTTTYLPPYLTDDSRVLNGTRVLEIISIRARLLSAGRLLDDALDPYLLLRDVWIKQHRDATFEGTRPVSLGDDDEFDEFDEFDDLEELEPEKALEESEEASTPASNE
jgi:phospholipid-binding lipoprotein MlaA